MNLDDEKTTDTNITSLINLIDSKAIKNALQRVPTEMWALTEAQLREIARPTQIDELLRQSLWDAIGHTMSIAGMGTKVDAWRVHKGVCTYTNFFNGVLSRPEKTCWLFQTPPHFNLSLEVLAHGALNKMREILSLPLEDSSGKRDHQLISRTIDMVQLLSKLVDFDQSKKNQW